ncbi:uncharacterized protein BXZ73DRAFT_73575 [Epithele typhae]|uniref:uncharacterized protein n=1 Tax=Epithele typhae TaxID=378194 RepID=UPI002007F4F9|nr:uncharacterized protein BXZ73DRAFT_76969 [Epithele typhae]XP_047883418.1 uncharacterized protein BXZ73DRAFT_73575 [Epithele typhae]KAH9934481.1 hypothetical protein BXZ73DRAFT_76969 [Epithele typhae]KAH9945429.1 hypothetical protein BXZ73DRAFT_73575 [Epithele typhae]
MVKFPSLSQTARVCNAWGESDTATGFHHTRSPGGRWFREWDQAHIAEVQSCDQAALGASGRTHGKHPAPVEPLEGEPHPAPAAQPMHQVLVPMNSESLSEVDPTKPRARKGLLNGARPPAPGQLILKAYKALYGNPAAAICGDAGCTPSSLLLLWFASDADCPPTTGDQMLEESDSKEETWDTEEPVGDASGDD